MIMGESEPRKYKFLRGKLLFSKLKVEAATNPRLSRFALEYKLFILLET